MQQRVLILRTVFFLSGLLLLIPLATTPTAAQDGTEPRTVHNACAAACVADTNFLHSGMGDAQAENAYHGWFGSYFELTGCDDPAWKTDILFLIDIVGDAVGAPGAPTMQCWQGLAAQASLCSSTCADYFIEDGRYGPNVELSLDQGSPGYLEVTLDNQSNLNKLPELQPNAYSRQFQLRTYLKYGDGEALLVGETPMPSLSFPNWITRGGLDTCIDQHGFDSSRCKLIANFATPSIVAAPVEFFDGVLYDLSDQVDDLSAANGSFSQDGYIRLLSDEDSITINQGPYAGYALVKTHYLWSGAHSAQIIPWDASSGGVTITNTECSSWLSPCWVFETRRETDTYVYALQGAPEKALEGTYTIEVVADMPHDKDFSDNRVSYAYDALAGSGQEQGETGSGEGEASGSIAIADLPITDLDGPGTTTVTLDPALPGAMFRLAVPDEVSFMFVRLVSLDGGDYDAFVRWGDIAVPDYPVISDAYDCWAQADPEYSGGCPYSNPYPDDYYVFVHRWTGGGAVQLEVEWTIPTPTATPTPTRVPTGTPTGMPEQEDMTGEPDDGGGEGSTTSEGEPNDSHAEADAWEMQGPFNGQLSAWGDRDLILLDFTEPGIYTFALTDVGAELRAKLTLVRASSGNVLDRATATVRGASVHLTMDASPGERYYLIISAVAMAPATNQAYTLSLSGFIPDPDEPNDSRDAATAWELADGPFNGYFWDKTTGRHDYFTFLAPQTGDGEPVTFELSNPAPDLRLRLTLIRPNGLPVANSGLSAPGQPVTLPAELDAGQHYYLKLETNLNRTSLQPYTLSAQYTAAAEDETGEAEPGRLVNVHGIVYQPGAVMPVPVDGVLIYAEVAGQGATVLDETASTGLFSGTVTAAEGQEVRIWAEKAGLTFQPAEDVWWPEPRERSHQTIFVVTGATLIQHTPVGDTPATATPQPTATPIASPTAVATAIPTATATVPPPTATPPPPQTMTVISGYLWRLFPESGPAGVGAASVFLTLNGVEQPATLSMIDGSYELTVPGIQPGDQFSLRADGPEDDFEPISYEWQAEAGVDLWHFDFYSYWGSITPPSSDDQNRLYGVVRDAHGNGVPGVTLLLQMGTSDALQVLGPTDANGHYEGYVRLPNRVMVTVWASTPGYVPSRSMFFHAYAPEDREIGFAAQP